MDPTRQGTGIGGGLYKARHELVTRLGLRRIRAGTRLRGYHHVAKELTADEYVARVVREELTDPTLLFQLKRGIHGPGGRVRVPPARSGESWFAALIEWLNPAAPENRRGQAG